MKKKILVFLALTIAFCGESFAQSKGIKAVYYREIIVPENIRSMPDGPTKQQALEQLSAKNKVCELYYANGEYGFLPSENALQNGVVQVEGDGSVYISADDKESVTQTEIIDKTFLIKEPKVERNWVIGTETREVLGKRCVKATYTKGKNQIVAWFCPEIPLPVGPMGYGGLPGKILQLVENGLMSYTVHSVEYLQAAVKMIPPKKGPVVTREKFNEILAKRLKSAGLEAGKVGVQVLEL